MVPVVSALCPLWFLKPQVRTYPVVLTVMESCSNFICKVSLEVIRSNSRSNQGSKITRGCLLRAPSRLVWSISKDGEHRGLPVQRTVWLLWATSQPLRKTRVLFISRKSNYFWLKPNKMAKHVSTPIIQFRNCLKTGQKPMTRLTYWRWEYIMCLLFFHISVMITAVIDASTTNWAITSEPYAARVASFQRAVLTVSAPFLKDARGCCKQAEAARLVGFSAVKSAALVLI